MTFRRGAAVVSFAFAALTACSGCTKGEILDYAMRGAPRPARRSGERIGPYRILAGDFHTHVLPPDAPWHVTRELPQTASIAEAEGLDFVVLTPHVPARFFLSPVERRWVLETQASLRSGIATLKTDVLFVPGMEYTDHEWGHLGLAFADVATVLDEVPLDAALAKPEAFFERWIAHGGLATINHPVARGIPRAGIADLRADISWRALRRGPQIVAPEIAWLTEHAPSIETYNLAIAHLRDQFFLSDEDFTFREATHLVDREARRSERIIAPVGGSDSHGGWLRATTWVLATERTPEAIRDAIVAGRTCVRGPETCTFEARAPGSTEWRNVGGSIEFEHAPDHGATIEARVRGGAATYYVNNEIVGSAEEGATVRVPVPDRCALVRVAVARSMSAPIYVGCRWANPSPR